ncbi:MAG: DNA polymerase III subunit beta [Rhodospirillaceae bacterium]|nr:DNA polymerase III subunit beta [Rhodospirillaceae bacterium]
MKLTIERSALLKSLGHVQNVVERRNTIPILSNVKISARDGKLSLNATDMDLDIIDDTDAVVSQPGETTAPAHTLYEIVRKLPDGSEVEIDASTDDGKLTLRSGRSRFSLSSISSSEFPVMSGGDMPSSFSISAVQLKELIERTRFAISTEETRYYLNGIYLHEAVGEGPVLRAVATDGHRLASADIVLPKGAKGMPGVIVPRKTVGELHKLIEETEGEIMISLSGSKIQFSFDGVVLTSKLIDGTFPDYERVIPSGNDKELVVGRKQFADSVDRVSAISTEKSRAVKMTLDGKSLVLSASSPESGSATDELETGYTGDKLEIGFNSAYLLEITRQIEGDNMTLTMSDAASPTIIREEGDNSALYVLMPMRV